MRVLVAVKRVVDHHVKIRLKSDGSGVDLAGLKMSMNPFDEIAVEQAVRLREAGLADEVVVVSCGTAAVQETLRTALAMGADRAMLVETGLTLESLHVARLLAVLCDTLAADLVLLGKQAIDGDGNQTGQMLAALKGWPQATHASAIERVGDALHVTREIDGGVELVRVPLPAVVTADLRLNEPRYVNLPSIMKARKKAIEQTTPEALGVPVRARSQVLAVVEPPRRAPGVVLGDVHQLAQRLKATLAA